MTEPVHLCSDISAQPQVIALMAHLTETCKPGPLPFLVVVPASLIPNWEAELAAFAPALTVHTYRGSGPQRAAAFQKQVQSALRGCQLPCRERPRPDACWFSVCSAELSLQDLHLRCCCPSDAGSASDKK